MKRSEAVTGLILIAIGAIFLMGNLTDTPMWSLGRLWPVILVVLGGAKVLWPGEGESRASGLPLLGVGCIFLAHNYRVMSLQESWPLFIVMAGVSILVGGTCQPRRAGGGQ